MLGGISAWDGACIAKEGRVVKMVDEVYDYFGVAS